MSVVDLNSDLGESFALRGFEEDSRMLAVVSSANVACGFHAGDPLTIRHTVAVAVARGVAVGAHVGYRDLDGFGRRDLDVPSHELRADLLYQLGALRALVDAEGGHLAYVKPHGALYHAAARDERVARDVASAVAELDPGLVVLGQPGTTGLAVAADLGLPVATEAFADRAYAPDGTLVPRGVPGAVLHDAEVVARRVLRLATEGVVEAVDGSVVAVEADSVCVHGDTPGAAAMAERVRAVLDEAGVTVRAFAGPAGTTAGG